MLPEITQWCREEDHDRGIRNCVLLLTEANGDVEGARTPFRAPTLPPEQVERTRAFASLPNCRLAEKKRLGLDTLAAAVSNMPRPVRVVVSGPNGFNSAVRDMLVKISVPEDAITILTA